MILISKNHIRKMTLAAEAAYPDECCGLLTGVQLENDSIEITRVVESRNIHPSGGCDRFEVDPKVRFDLMRELGEISGKPEGPERLIGHYHSHPDQPTTPSDHDLSCAFEPELFWVILSLSKGFVKNVDAYKLNVYSSEFYQIPLQHTGGPTYAITPNYDQRNNGS